MDCQAKVKTYHGDTPCLRKAKAGGSLCWQHGRKKDWGRSGMELAADLLEEVTKRRENMDGHVREQIERNFTYHAPKEGQPDRYEAIRYNAKVLAKSLVDMTPVSREQSLALTNLEQAVFWANAAIARNE